MDLYYFHRVLIASAILFCLGFSVYAYRQYDQLDQGVYLVMTIASSVACVVMTSYLVYFNIAIGKLIHKRNHQEGV